jgi:hypothetical protein
MNNTYNYREGCVHIVCPHCGCEHEESFTYTPGEINCIQCAKPFFFEVEARYTSWAEVPEDDQRQPITTVSVPEVQDGPSAQPS